MKIDSNLLEEFLFKPPYRRSPFCSCLISISSKIHNGNIILDVEAFKDDALLKIITYGRRSIEVQRFTVEDSFFEMEF